MKKTFVLIFCLLTLVSTAQVRKVKLPELQSMVASQDTLYVVNFWSTWCKPCLQELPSFDSLSHNQLGPVKFLLVSLDFAENLKTKVEPTLKNKHITLPCVLLDETDGNYFIPAIHRNWTGSIPATLFIYNGRTQLVEKKMHLAQIRSHMKTLLPSLQ